MSYLISLSALTNGSTSSGAAVSIDAAGVLGRGLI